MGLSSFRVTCVIIASLPMVFVPIYSFAQKAEKAALDRKDTRVEPTSWGRVIGRVYDAETGAPIKDAAVVVQQDGKFEEKGRTVDKTDDLGGYKAQAVLGRISSNFDIGRALLSSPAGLLFGTATNTTKRIDVARLTLRATAPGYKPLECAVTARGADASAFQLEMEPLLLVPEGQEGISTVGDGWGAVRIRFVEVSPSIAKPGDTLKLRAWLTAFGDKPGKTVQIGVISDLWKGTRRLKSAGPQPDGSVLFEGDCQVSRKEKDRVAIAEFRIEKSVLDYAQTKTRAPVIIQITSSPDGDQAASLRSAALDDWSDGRVPTAAEKFGSLANRTPADPFDMRTRGILCEQTSDYTAAADSWKNLVLRAPKPDVSDVNALARVLTRASRYSEVPDVVEPVFARIKKKDQHLVIPASLIGYLGQAYVKLDRVDKASDLNDRLLDWETAGLSEAVIDFRNMLHMAEVTKALAASPNSALAKADYGRALMDEGRYEEAVTSLNEALAIDPTVHAVKRDLAWASIHLREQSTQVTSLNEAIDQAEAALNLGKGKQVSKDFSAWQQYALLLYVKADALRKNGSSTADIAFDKAIDALREALSVGRKGAKRNAGSYNAYLGQYLSGSEVAISGFAYPQANSCFVILESVKQLRRTPDEQHALYNLGSAFAELGHYELASDALVRLRKVRQDYPQEPYLSAIISAGRGDVETGMSNLKRAISTNPRHPRAYPLLADLLAKNGDTAGAAEVLTNYHRYYDAGASVRGNR